MEVHDIIYGSFDIKEPALIELINSKPIQRLKGVAQYGIPDEFYHFKNYSRYEHSIGVMLLLRKFGAGLEEQIAGLLHDASTPSFSHVIDIVKDNLNEDSHDANHENFLSSSELSKILLKYNFGVKKIADIQKFTLLEREAPNLCADRIDYALREFYHRINPSIVNPCLDNLQAFAGKFIFTSKVSAEIFGKNYLKCQTEHWGSPETCVRYYLFSQILKIALKEKIITQEDFSKDDYFVTHQLLISKNMQINNLLNTLSGKLEFEVVDENPQLDLKKKFRHVDPEYLENGVLHHLSENQSYKAFLEEHRAINKKGVKVRLLA